MIEKRSATFFVIFACHMTLKHLTYQASSKMTGQLITD
jgi:hypothetical protein